MEQKCNLKFEIRDRVRFFRRKNGWHDTGTIYSAVYSCDGEFVHYRVRSDSDDISFDLREDELELVNGGKCNTNVKNKEDREVPKFVIRKECAKEEKKPTEVWLENGIDGSICMKASNGESYGSFILSLCKDGTITLHQCVGDDLGLNTSGVGRSVKLNNQ